ncbi:MAG: hypothetical protein NUV76_11875, partial [Candidatus Kuenenia sp.]|nr:hypothetical protein [Candidatus Kuenenia sp.]
MKHERREATDEGRGMRDERRETRDEGREREHSRFFVTCHFSRMKREYRTAEQGISNYEVFL